MNDEPEARIRRAQVTGKGESRTDGLAERHRLEAERQATERVTEEAENAAVSRWAAPVSGTHVERGNEAVAVTRRSVAKRQVTEEAENAAVSRWAAPVSGTHVERGNEAARIAKKAREAGAAARGSATERRE
jgi:hypothetical protein